MKFNQITKMLVVAVMISMVAGIVTAQEVETQETPDDLEEQVDNQTELPEQSNARLPGDRFYGLTQASERFELAVARAPVIGSADREARTLANHAERRIAEAEGLAARNDTERASQAVDRYSQAIERASEASERSGNEETQQRIAEASSRHEEALQRVASQVPEEAQEGIQRAMENSQRARDAVGRLSDAGPSGQAPEDTDSQEQAPSREGSGQVQPDEEQTQQPDETNQESSGQETENNSQSNNSGQGFSDPR